MSHCIRFLFVLHDHQPIGNFDNVFEQAYQDSYRPFLDVFERYPRLKMALHTSGPLMEWLDVHHPEYLERLARLVAAGRIEIIGGPFYEPILSMIPSRDRVGQISCYRRWLEDRLQARIRGMWMPERVWEQSMTRDLAAAGVEYTLLDDFHFKNAGLTESQLNGYYLTEDDGHLLAVFPDSEPLRYLIPFGSPQEVIDHLGRIHQAEPGADGPVRRRRRKAGRLAGDETARLRRRLVGAVFRSADGRTKAGSKPPRPAKCSTRFRRWARSICPREAIAR